jgi:hypothetical protein
MVFLKRLLAAALLSFIGFIVYVTFPAWSSMFASTPTTFTTENWHGAHKYRREVMAKEFLDRHPYVGMSQDEVIQLLGKPDYQSVGKLHYFVALTAADYIALSFELDSDHRVVKAYLHQT